MLQGVLTEEEVLTGSGGSPGARHENTVNSGEEWSSLGLVGRRNEECGGGGGNDRRQAG